VSTPFPGMDPYLEHPDLWPDVHNGLIAAIRDALSPLVRPRYYVALEERTYLEEPAELVLVGRPDLAVVARSPALDSASEVQRAAAMVEVEIPMADAVRETYLEVRSVPAGEVVTVVELLSPANKRSGTGRRVYLEKRELVFSTRTNLVEVDRCPRSAHPLSPNTASSSAVLESGPKRISSRSAFATRSRRSLFLSVAVKRSRSWAWGRFFTPSTTVRATTYGSTTPGRPCPLSHPTKLLGPRRFWGRIDARRAFAPVTLTADATNRHYGLAGAGVAIDNGDSGNSTVAVGECFASKRLDLPGSQGRRGLRVRCSSHPGKVR